MSDLGRNDLEGQGSPDWGTARARLRESLGLELEVRGGALLIRSGALAVRVEVSPVEVTHNPQNPLFMAWDDPRYTLCRYEHEGRELHAFEPAFALNPMNSAMLAADRAAIGGILGEAGVPVPRLVPCPTGRPEGAEAALGRAGIRFPLVVRPPGGYRGGVQVQVQDLAELARCLAAAARVTPLVLLQEQVAAEHELRLFVLDGRVLAASRKRRPVVIGDGGATIAELLERENTSRRERLAPLPLLEPFYGTRVRRPLLVDPGLHRSLASQGLALETRPAAGQRVALGLGRTLEAHEDAGPLAGELPRRLALNAAAALDLRAAWVDLAVTGDGTAWVLEVSPRPRPDPYLTGPSPVDMLTPLLAALFTDPPPPAAVPWLVDARSAAGPSDAEFDAHPPWAEVVARVGRAIGAELKSYGGGTRVELAKRERRILEEETGHTSFLPLFGLPVPRRMRRYTLLPDGRRLHANHVMDLMTHSLNSMNATLCSFDKLATTHLLARAGLPLVRGGVVESLEGALELVGREGLRYPLVCKPVYGLKGMGVTVRIQDADGLRTAMAHAHAVSSRVIVEEFFEGREFRVITLDGGVISRIEKRHPSVVGDGGATVRELLERGNAAARAVRPPRSPLLAQYYPPAYELPLDEELAQTLALQGLTLESVVPAGTEVTCRLLRNLFQGARWSRAERLPRRADEVALAAQQATGLRTAAMDLLVADPDDEHSELRVIEVNGGYGAMQSGIWEEIYDDVFFPTIGAALGRGDVAASARKTGK